MSQPSLRTSWEVKTVEQLTQGELLDWVKWNIERSIPGRRAEDLATDIVHNVLLWERNKEQGK